MAQYLFDLRLFDGEGGAAAAGASGQGAGQSGTAQQSTAGNQTQPTDEKARRAAFDAYLGEHKDLYEERVRTQLDRRMKTADAEREQLRGLNARHQQLAQALGEKYGVNSDDIDALLKAVNEDDRALDEQAAEMGWTREQLKHVRAIEAENARFKAAQEASERQKQRDAVLARWHQEAEQLKGVYADFDLQSELQNKDFADMLGKGVNMRMAYQVVHMDDLLSNAVKYAVDRTSDKVAASVKANGMRPSEGAGAGSAPAAMTMDVNNMTKAQREELERRALRGEKITL